MLHLLIRKFQYCSDPISLLILGLVFTLSVSSTSGQDLDAGPIGGGRSGPKENLSLSNGTSCLGGGVMGWKKGNKNRVRRQLSEIQDCFITSAANQ